MGRKSSTPFLSLVSLITSLFSLPLGAASELNYPRISFDDITGIAIVNPTGVDATVSLRAYGTEGQLIAAAGFTNPAQLMVPAGQQISIVVQEVTSLFGSLQSGILANVPPQQIPGSFRPDAQIPQLRVSPSLSVLSPGSTQDFISQGISGRPDWLVNGVVGGSPSLGTIDASGRYDAPANMPATLPVSIAARLEGQLAAASVDVLTPEVLIQNLGTVQSIAYLSGVARLFAAELFFGPTPSQAGSGFTSRIRDVTPGIERTLVELNGEDVAHMIPFRGIDGREYLLLAASVSGQIQRLDPSNGNRQAVASNIEGPRALVEDPTTGDLLVAAGNQVLRVSRANLNSGLTSAALERERMPISAPHGVATVGFSLEGIAVNPCNGNIVVSSGEITELIEIGRATGLTRVLSNRPLGHLLYVLRSGVPCPQGAQLLGVDFSQNGIFLYTGMEGDGFVPWAQGTESVTSLTGLPSPNTFELEDSILFSQTDFSTRGEIVRVETPGIYDPSDIATNPPLTHQST